MNNEPIIASWDFKASPKEIADRLNDALDEAGIKIHFYPGDNDGDSIELVLNLKHPQ